MKDLRTYHDNLGRLCFEVVNVEDVATTAEPATPSIPVKDVRTNHFLVYYGVTSRRALKLSPTADIEKILVELATEPADFVNYVAETMGIVIDDEYIHEDEVTNGGFSLCVVDQDGYESTIWEEVPEEGDKEPLLDAVMEEIKENILKGDLDAIYKLLSSCDSKHLVAFLPEEMHHKFSK